MKNKQPSWIVFPVSLALMRHDYTVMQTRVLVQVIVKLQSVLHDVLNCKRSTGTHLFAPHETDSEGNIHVRIFFKELGVTSNHYAQLCAALEDMQRKPVELPVKTQDGKRMAQLSHLMKFSTPPADNRLRYAVVTMSGEVARIICSLQMGYQRLSLNVVNTCSNRHTIHIYMFMESWARRGYCTINVEEFRQLLCMGDTYAKFSEFMRRVIKPARTQIDKMSAAGLCVSHFTVDAHYKGNNRKSCPQTLTFKAIDAAEQTAEVSSMQREQLTQMLCRHFWFTKAAAGKIVSMVTTHNYTDIMIKLTEVYGRVHRDHTIKDRAVYLYRSIASLLCTK